MTVDEQRLALIAEAKSFLGTPYHHQGWLKGVGVDCVTLLALCYRTIGVVPDDFNPGNYSREWYMHKSEEVYMAGVARYAHRLPDGVSPKPADVALYKVGRCVSHGAIIIDDDLIIHANRKARQVEIALRRDPALVQHLHSYWSPFT